MSILLLALQSQTASAQVEPTGVIYPRNPVIASGSTVLLRVSAQSRQLTYQWQANGVVIPGATDSTLAVTMLSETNAGEYQCLVKDEEGATSVLSTTVYMLDPTLIPPEGQPLDVHVAAGEPAVFSVAPVCGTNLTIQWRRNGAPLTTAEGINGVNSSTLSIPDAQGKHMAYYDAVVRCGLRSATSRSAVLALEPVIAWGRDAYVPSGLSNVVDLAVGGSVVVGLLGTGGVIEWDGTSGSISTPSPREDHAIAISAGSGHRLALRDDGTVSAWGDNSYGQSSVPVGLSNVIAVSAGGYHSLALRSDGTVVAWGANWVGQTGVPAGLSNVTAIAAGWYHNLALKEDGTVVAWGANDSGQTSVPVEATDVKAIAAGGFHSLAHLRDGRVLAWGDESQSQTSVPVGLTNAAFISAGAYHSAAIRADGTVVAWGDNQQGQIAVPVTLTNVVRVTCGVAHTVALVSRTPVIWIYPYDPSVSSGEAVSLRVKSAWVGPLAYQWLYQGRTVDGATNSWLSVANFRLTDAGMYACAVRTTSGFRSLALSTVYFMNPELVSLAPTNQWGQLGANLQLSVSAGCPGAATYQWRKDGEALVDDDFHTGAQTPVLQIAGASLDHAGSYDVVVRCGVETAVSAPAIVEVGRSVRVAWDPSPSPGIAGYRVYYGLRSRAYTSIADVGLATNHLLQGLADGTLYYLAVTAYDTQSASSDFSEEIYYVTPGVPVGPLQPKILQQPIDQAVAVGDNAVFKVIAEGADTLAFQWRKDGVNLTDGGHFMGVNQPELRVEAAGAEEAGSYSVLVTNVIGGAASSEARLRVRVVPKLLRPEIQSDGSMLLSIVNADGSPLTDLQAYRYWIQTRADLTQDAWTYVDLPMQLVDGELVMEDPVSSIMPQRFFRSVQIADPPARLRVMPPQRQASGSVRLSVKPEGNTRVLTPADAQSIRVEATDDLASPEGWSQLPGVAQLTGGLLVLEDSEAQSRISRFYRARIEHVPEVRLRGEVRESDGVFLLHLGRHDGLPLSSSDVFNYQVVVSHDLLGSTDWTPLSASMRLTNGVLQVIDPSTNSSPRFYRIYAR